MLTRRSTTGYVVFAAGGPLAWGLDCRLQSRRPACRANTRDVRGDASDGVV